MFNGQSAPNLTPMNDTWLWDGTTWTEVKPTTSPPARDTHAMATLKGKVFLFGGEGAGNGIWRWDGTTWTEIVATIRPVGRYGHAMATLGDKIVLFGGSVAGAARNDTWTFDGTTWTEQHPALSPEKREAHAMATLNGKIVPFGGVGTAGAAMNVFKDTWAFDGMTWTQIATLANPNQAYAGGMAALGNKLVAPYLGTLIWDGSTWTRSSAAPPLSVIHHATAAYDGKVMIFGGWAPGALSSTQTFDGTAWTTLTPANPPAARTGARMAVFP